MHRGTPAHYHKSQIIPSWPPLSAPSLCSGSSYTSGECVSNLFLVTTSTWWWAVKEKVQPVWVRGKTRRRRGSRRREGSEEGYIAPRVSLHWFRPVSAPFPFSSLAFPPPAFLYSSHCFSCFFLLSYFGLIFFFSLTPPASFPFLSCFPLPSILSNATSYFPLIFL